MLSRICLTFNSFALHFRLTCMLGKEFHCSKKYVKVEYSTERRVWFDRSKNKTKDNENITTNQTKRKRKSNKLKNKLKNDTPKTKSKTAKNTKTKQTS